METVNRTLERHEQGHRAYIHILKDLVLLFIIVFINSVEHAIIV